MPVEEMRDTWLFGTWDRLLDDARRHASSGPLWLLAPIAARWHEHGLEVKAMDEVLRIERDALFFGDRTVAREDYLGAKAEVRVPNSNSKRRRRGADAIPTYHLHLSVRANRGFRVRIHNSLAVRELVRILDLWATDAQVQEHWGSDAVERFLMPDLDDDLVQSCGGSYTTEGITFPCLGVFERVDRIGCGVFLAVFLASPLCGLLGGTAYGAGLWSMVVAAAVIAYVAFFTWRYQQLWQNGTFLLGQHGLVLVDGTRVPYEQMRAVVPGDQRFLLVTDEEAYAVTMRPGIYRLALAVHALRTTGESTEAEVPAALARLLAARSGA